MAALHAPSASFLSVFLPVARASLFPSTKPITLLQQLQQHARSAINISLVPAALLPIPGLLGEVWDGLLNAVPKKKTSHMKKRHRQMAGKALKDVTALNRCSSCGRQKRAHILCPYCVTSIRQWLGNGFKSADQIEEEAQTKREAEEAGEHISTEYDWRQKYDKWGRWKSEKKLQTRVEKKTPAELKSPSSDGNDARQNSPGALGDTTAQVNVQTETQQQETRPDQPR